MGPPGEGVHTDKDRVPRDATHKRSASEVREAARRGWKAGRHAAGAGEKALGRRDEQTLYRLMAALYVSRV